jgi:hypothetical protein
VLLALSVAGLVLVTGCGVDTYTPPKAQPPSSSPAIEESGVVVVGMDPEEVDVTQAPGVSPGLSLSFASPVYSISVASELSAPTKVQLLLDNALPRQTPVFVATRRAPSNPWTYLPGRLMTDQRHVEFTTSHLSDFGVLAMDVDGALQNFRDDVRARLDGGVDPTVAKPVCNRSEEARKDGYSVGFSRGKNTAFWCFGFADEARAITVVNRRTVPIQVTHSTAPAVEPVRVPKAWTAWAGVLGDKDTTFLAPGRSVTYDVDLEPRKRVLISATTDSNAQSLRALHATVGALAAAAKDFGAGESDTVDTVNALLARPQCARTLGQGSDKMLAGCFSAQKVVTQYGSRGLLLSRLTTAPSTAAFLRKLYSAMAAGVVKDGNQNILVRRAAPNFSAFVGTYSGEARSMMVAPDGIVFESVSNVTDDGVKRVADITYQLSDPETDGGVSRAQAVITEVRVYDRQAFRNGAPKVGATGTFRLEKGVVRSPFVNRNYCGPGARKGVCD